MNRLTTNSESDKVDISIHNVNGLGARIILIILGVLIFGLPLVGFLINFLDDRSDNNGVYLGILAYTLFMIILSRFLFWGLWGAECISINKDSLTVIYDYKFWKSKPQKYLFSELEISICDEEIRNEVEIAKLKFNFVENEYSTVLKISTERINEVGHLISKIFPSEQNNITTLLPNNRTYENRNRIT